MKTWRNYAKFGRPAIAALTLGMVLMFGAVPRSQAQDRAACQQRIENAEDRLERAISRHGDLSPQAEERRHELLDERERCWREYNGWWNGREHLWHSERDWDRDHDRDVYRSNPAFQNGFSEGLRIGHYDRETNRAYQPGNYKAYKNNGDAAYRNGFVAGYDEGFGRR